MKTTHQNQPLVSILINNYNYAAYVGQAIESALAQDYSRVEVVVVDDGSTDHSRMVIDTFDDRIVKVYQQNGGQAAAMNAGFRASRGEIICFLDADDLYLPNKATTVVQQFQSVPEIAWVFHESVPIRSNQVINVGSDEIIEKIAERQCDRLPTQIDFRQNLKNAELPTFTPSTSNLCFSRTLAEEMFPLPEIAGLSGLAICDNYLKMMAVGLGTGIKLHQDLGIFRVHSSNLYSTQPEAMQRKIFSEISIATGYCMRKNWTGFEKMSDKLFSKGLGTYWRSQNPNKTCNQLIREYFSKIPIIDKTRIFASSLYYYYRLGFTDIV